MIPPSLLASDGMWIVSGCSRGRVLVGLWIPGALLILVVWLPRLLPPPPPPLVDG